MENENTIVKKNISPKRIALIVLVVVAVVGFKNCLFEFIFGFYIGWYFFSFRFGSEQ
jgi:hypothetical protein